MNAERVAAVCTACAWAAVAVLWALVLLSPLIAHA